jgi:outer membrane protein OmpA-like peptidoglycan-associated protein
MVVKRRNCLWLVSALILFGFLAGCAQSGLEWAPKGPYLAYHKELPAAERAVEAARAAGKDRECPAEFAAAEKLKDDAYQTYWACRTNEAIGKANDAAARANALCPKRAVAPVVPPPPAVPTAAISVSPTTIQAGQCATLTWSATNATATTLNHGLGAVAPSGTRQVCPTSTAAYLLTATGAGGIASEVATVNVTAPPPPAVPTATITASPTSVRKGQCATLIWSSTNATATTLNHGLGAVDSSGSRQVCPASTASYLLTATGAGGVASEVATVTVTAPPPAAPVLTPAPEQLTLRINFDTDKATIRPADAAELQKAVAFVQRYPGRRIAIVGHTDNVGNPTHNQRLSERRAAAVKDYLLQHGVSGGERLTTVGYGQTRPIADNATATGRAQNRRVELVAVP